MNRNTFITNKSTITIISIIPNFIAIDLIYFDLVKCYLSASVILQELFQFKY